MRRPGFSKAEAIITILQLILLINARNVTVFTQTNVSSQYLTDPALRLPFTSFLYIAAGQNVTDKPPATIRISQLPNLNTSRPNVTYANESSEDPEATILYIQHLANFTLPAAINSPNGLAWHAHYIGDVNETALSPHTLMRTWGTGLLADIWQLTAMEFDKRYWIPLADENIYILNLLDKWGVTNSVGYQSYKQQLSSWRSLTEGTPKTKQVRVNAMRIDMSNEGEGRVYQNSLNDILSQGLKEIEEGEVRRVDFLNLAKNPNTYLRESLQPTDSASSLHGARSLNIKGPALPNTVYETKVSFVRQGGIFSMLSVISEETATVLNELVRVVALTICIIDFIDGNYVGGALGLVGVAFTSILPMFFDNPLGVLYGTLIAILFFILPGAFSSQPTPPPTNNNTKIIQYSFFGDMDHTGNEKCAQKHPGCVASYGPGIVALTFKWEWFDAIVFMIWANEGFPMTIPDMAKAFSPALSFNEDLSHNQSAVAQITCGDHYGTHLVPGRMGQMQWTAGTPSICNKPQFHLNRSNIILPRINRTAADVYNDIIDENGGSCKIIDNSNNPVTVPNYGIQIQGLPVAIACGINATVNGFRYISGDQAAANVTGSGKAQAASPTSSTDSSLPSASSLTPSLSSPSPTTAMYNTSAPQNNTSNITTSTPSVSTQQTQTTQISSSSLVVSSNEGLPSGSSPGSLSTDGRGGEGYVPPPPPNGFAAPLYPGNSACFVTDVLYNFFCLPNGTYDRQIGTFQYNSTKSLLVRMPQGASLVVRYYKKFNRGDIVDQSDTFTTNQTNSATSQFAQDMQRMSGLSFDILVPEPTPPPLACVFTKKDYKGDATCFGVGGGNMTDGAGEVASVKVMGGAAVTLYPHAYGHASGLAFSVSVSDVSTIPYGVNGSFEGLIKGLWVQSNITYIT